jgi:alkanesulfonate monooxygenase SsuD/methylene tetrahydromethanopterin reductase-like flavin-dependent oxidoreductase (luciferase family)
MSRIGIAISGGPNPAAMIGLVVLAESLGYESAWVAEGHGGDQFAILAACATRTSRILLGTSISSVFVRTAPTIAMAASTIADISGGRFILGPAAELASGVWRVEASEAIPNFSNHNIPLGCAPGGILRFDRSYLLVRLGTP